MLSNKILLILRRKYINYKKYIYSYFTILNNILKRDNTKFIKDIQYIYQVR